MGRGGIDVPTNPRVSTPALTLSLSRGLLDTDHGVKNEFNVTIVNMTKRSNLLVTIAISGSPDSLSLLLLVPLSGVIVREPLSGVVVHGPLPGRMVRGPLSGVVVHGPLPGRMVCGPLSGVMVGDAWALHPAVSTTMNILFVSTPIVWHTSAPVHALQHRQQFLRTNS